MADLNNTPENKSRKPISIPNATLYRSTQQALRNHLGKASGNLEWLYAHLHPYFFITMKDEIESIVNLAVGLHNVALQKKIVLADRADRLIVACLDFHGSLYDTLKTLEEREISYAELTHSYASLPGSDKELEIQRYEFKRKTRDYILGAGKTRIPDGTKKAVREAMNLLYPNFDFREFDDTLRLLWLNNEHYVRISPPERIARVLWLYEQGRKHGGLYINLEATEDIIHHKESRLLFSVGNPPQIGFMAQAMEVFQRLSIGVRRSYSLTINTGIHPYFLGTFYITKYDGTLVRKGSDLFQKLKIELYNTQILSPTGATYNDLVTSRIMTGEDASLTNAFIAFCHTTLSHNQPDRFDREVVSSAFHSDVEITLKLINAFKTRFDPDIKGRRKKWEKALDDATKAIDAYNTGQRYLDEIRRTVFQTCLSFILHTLKTNYFVHEKHALAFRLDPAYLAVLGSEFTSDLPRSTPFRITFFFGRHGIGYHIGFSDIARGGWRTIICRNEDEQLTNTDTLFREVFVLAHTQHLKNKDIYEGGSKMTVVLDATDISSQEAIIQRLYKTQYGFINAFLDLFVTQNGKTKNPRVIDYYGEDEPIELGPDENMHDSMIEEIAKLSVKRGYILGIGIMSSKQVGINHKEYGVTSRGVMKFAEIAMKEHGVNMRRDAFTITITGGTNGDVAGNCMRLLVDRCPGAQILSIAAGAGALYDPKGVNKKALGRLILKKDVTDFAPQSLHPGGFILFRRNRKKDGIRELHRKLLRTDSGVEEQWITADEFHRQFESLIFSVATDLFFPCGGRPETIDMTNWQKMFAEDGTPAARIIVEGANSYITPDARIELQNRGVVVLRDASANKCGVISSSYEIIANLLMTEKEFLAHKAAYVRDVLKILEKRAEDEANLIFKRHRQGEEQLLYTEIANAISADLNNHYTRLFAFFRERPALANQRLFQKVLLSHLPAFIRKSSKYRARIKKLPEKIRYAILASEIATSIVYHGGWNIDLETQLKAFVKEQFT